LAVFLAVAFFGWISFTYFRGLLRVGYIDSAIGTVHSLVTEESHFAEAHPNVGYSCKMSDLDSNEMIREMGKTGGRNGYSFELICPARERTGARDAFQIVAHPIHAGMPVFCSDQSGVLRSDYGGSPTKCLHSRDPM
jgi:hypothetical protein